MWTNTFQVRTPQSLGLAGVSAPGKYNLSGHLLGVHLLHLRGRDEAGHVDRYLSGKDTAESSTRWRQSSRWTSNTWSAIHLLGVHLLHL